MSTDHIDAVFLESLCGPFEINRVNWDAYRQWSNLPSLISVKGALSQRCLDRLHVFSLFPACNYVITDSMGELFVRKKTEKDRRMIDEGLYLKRQDQWHSSCQQGR